MILAWKVILLYLTKEHNIDAVQFNNFWIESKWAYFLPPPQQNQKENINKYERTFSASELCNRFS
jgi:hypothetical protein